MRLWVAVLTVTVSCGFVEPDPAARTIGFATANQEDMDAVQEVSDRHNATDEFDEGDDHGGDPTSAPTAIHLPSLPSLPDLPQLPALPALLSQLFPPRSTITATKTLYAEVTRLVTRHPVCLTVRGVKPPCLSANLNRDHDPDCWKHHDALEEGSVWDDDQREGLYIEPTSVLRLIPATSQLPAPQKAEDIPELEPSREARYLEFRRETPTPATGTSTDNPVRLLNLPADTHFATQTLWITRVLEVTDHRITATLEAKNCVPRDLKMPFCQTTQPQKPLHTATTTVPHQMSNQLHHAASEASDNHPAQYKPLDLVHSQDDKQDIVSPVPNDGV